MKPKDIEVGKIYVRDLGKGRLKRRKVLALGEEAEAIYRRLYSSEIKSPAGPFVYFADVNRAGLPVRTAPYGLHVVTLNAFINWAQRAADAPESLADGLERLAGHARRLAGQRNRRGDVIGAADRRGLAKGLRLAARLVRKHASSKEKR